MAALDVDVAIPVRDFTVRARFGAGAEILALVGPSGAGKTTILRALAGLAPAATGRIACDEAVWLDTTGRGRRHVPPERRGVGYVPQHQALFPHRSVRGNVVFGGAPAADVDGLLDRLGIAHLAGQSPAALSGGERQRVALARALAREPALMLLDEPLTGLDAHTRADVRAELGAALRRLGIPAIVVTHDFADAAALADRVLVLRTGTVRQLAPPAELIARPADAFVAVLTGGAVVTHGGAQVCVHPWNVTVGAGDGPQGALTGVVTEVRAEAGRTLVRAGDWTGALPPGAAAPGVGDRVHGVIEHHVPVGAP